MLPTRDTMQRRTCFVDVLVKHLSVFWRNDLRHSQALGEGMASLVFTNHPKSAWCVCGDDKSKRLRSHR
jgi:hypothetical protein